MVPRWSKMVQNGPKMVQNCPKMVSGRRLIKKCPIHMYTYMHVHGSVQNSGPPVLVLSLRGHREQRTRKQPYMHILYIYIYIHMRTYIHTYIHTYIQTHGNTYKHMQIHANTCIYLYVYICMHAHLCMFYTECYVPDLAYTAPATPGVKRAPQARELLEELLVDAPLRVPNGCPEDVVPWFQMAADGRNAAWHSKQEINAAYI